MNLHVSQIFLSDTEAPLPPPLAEATALVRRFFPKADYRLYDAVSLRAFIAERFGGDVLRAYDCLKPYAYKADLGRYCLVHELGGWYFDVTIRPTMPINLNPDIEAVLFRDIDLGLPYGWGVQCAVFFARPRARFLAGSIEAIVANCRRRDHCRTPFSITGPGLLGRVLADIGELPGIIYGDRLALTPHHAKKNIAYVMPDGAILAWAKQVGNGGDLTPFGATGTNNYKTMWQARDVFGAF